MQHSQKAQSMALATLRARGAPSRIAERLGATSFLGAKAMNFSGPILAIGDIKPGGPRRTGADPVCVTIEVRTATTMNDFVSLEIARDAAADLAKKLTNFLDAKQ
jgi:hypothetical protein